MSKSHDTPHETNLYTEYLLVDAFEENDPSADFCFEDAFNHYFENYPLCTAPRFETRAPRYQIRGLRAVRRLTSALSN